MARGKCTFRESDVKRAIKAVRAAGENVRHVVVEPDGKIVVEISKPDAKSDDKEIVL